MKLYKKTALFLEMLLLIAAAFPFSASAYYDSSLDSYSYFGKETVIRFHDLRHTFATHALVSGVDAKTLSGILGHTNASFTLDTYTHLTTDMQKNASNIVGSFMDEIMLEGDGTNS